MIDSVMTCITTAERNATHMEGIDLAHQMYKSNQVFFVNDNPAASWVMNCYELALEGSLELYPHINLDKLKPGYVQRAAAAVDSAAQKAAADNVLAVKGHGLPAKRPLPSSLNLKSQATKFKSFFKPALGDSQPAIKPSSGSTDAPSSASAPSSTLDDDPMLGTYTLSSLLTQSHPLVRLQVTHLESCLALLLVVPPHRHHHLLH